MNTHDNLVTLKGESAEIQRFLLFIFEDNLVTLGVTDLSRGRGFNRLNDLLKPGDWCVCCYDRVQWDEDLSRLCVESKGQSIGRLLVAASKEFKLAFELETMDIDANPEEVTVNPSIAVWKQYVIQDGTARRFCPQQESQ
jgi:hypothetical protein